MKIFSIIAILAGILMALPTEARHSGHLRLTRPLKDSLRNEIDTMLVNDQKYRWVLSFGETDPQKVAAFRKMDDSAKFRRMSDVLHGRAGIAKAILDSIGRLQNQIDSANFFRLVTIIKTYGFPHKYVPGYKAAAIIGHAANPLKDENFLLLLRNEVRLRNLTPIEYARIYDKLQLEERKPELYYVVNHFDNKTNTTRHVTPTDLQKTNEARKQIGLRKYKP